MVTEQKIDRPSPIGFPKKAVTDEEQEFIGTSLHWFIRKGNLIVLLLLLIFVFFCWLIQYPDSIKAKAKIFSLELPQTVVAKTDGRLDTIFVKNGDQVKKDQQLGFIESIGNREEIILLKQWLDTTLTILNDPNHDTQKQRAIPYFKNLGELQSAYQSFEHAWKAWFQTLNGGYHEHRINSIHRDMEQLLHMKNNLDRQIQFQQGQLELSEKELNAYEKLAIEKVIAPLELDRYKTQVIRDKQSLKQISTQTISTQLNYEAKSKELIEIEEQKRQLKQACHSSLLDLKVKMEQWMEKFCLISPREGFISIAAAISPTQHVTAGQIILYIDNASSPFYAEVTVNQAGFGKIRKGQKVIINPLGFPEEEYGSIIGEVVEIATHPDKDDNFPIKISIESGKTRNSNNDIQLQHGLIAEAEIITNERRLLDRFLGKLYLVFN